MVLFTEFYKDNQEYQIDIIKNNFNNKFISKIVLFVDKETKDRIQHPKVLQLTKTFSSIDDKLQFCKSYVKTDICIVSQQPFNETVACIPGYDLTDRLLIVEHSTYIFRSDSNFNKKRIYDDQIISFGFGMKKETNSSNVKQHKVITDRLDVLIISVNYNDYLDITLRNNLQFLNNIHVITSTQDIECQELCKKYEVDCIVTDSFYDNGDAFNKARALNYGISQLEEPSWILTLDADILVYHTVNVKNLDINTLYSTQREVIKNISELEKYLSGQEYVSRVEPTIGFGYYQLFNINSNSLSKGWFLDSFTDASRYDIEFKKRFKKIENLNQKVVHVGPTRLNWTGRKSDVIKKVDECTKVFDINQYFDKIYCINLDRRKDRWQKVNQEFKRLGINVQRFKAVDGKKIINKSTIDPFVESCFLSHINVIKDAKKNKYKRILVFEDDVLFDKQFKSRVHLIQNNDWKLLYLGASQFIWSKINIEKDYYVCNNTFGSFAYAVDESLYDDLINLSQEISKPYDHCLVDIQNKNQNCRVIYPNLVISDVSQSDLRESQDTVRYARRVKWQLENYQKTKSISIIIPCYGHSEYLLESIESCLSQTFLPDRIVVLLMDESSKKLKSQIEKLSDIISCLESDRLDLSVARNLLVQNTNTDFFIPLDADDKLPNNFIEKVIEHDADVVYVGSRYFGSIQGTWPDPIDEEIDWVKLTTFRRNSLVCTALIKRDPFVSIGGYNQKLKAYEDLDLWIRMYKNGFDFKKCKDTHLEYRKHNNGSMLMNTNKHEQLVNKLKSIILEDDFYNRVPKIIHFVWLGDKPFPKDIMSSWKKFLPEKDWTYMMWNESNFDMNSCQFLKESFRLKKYGICVDYIRAKVLYDYGGLWLDADCLINSDISCFLQYDFFASWEDDKYINIGLLGCSRDLELMYNLTEYYKNLQVNSETINSNEKFVRKIGTGPMVLTREISKFFDIEVNAHTLQKDYLEKRFLIETPDVFVLDDSSTGRKNFAVHLFDGSWTDKKEEWSVVVRKNYNLWKIKNNL